MKKPILANDKIYHIYNRGVEKRIVFLDDSYYYRFIHDLYEFNDDAPAGKFSSVYKIGSPTSDSNQRTLLVDILAFCLMPNHFHLLLRQRMDNGITKFMRKLGTGFTNFFNKENKRVGPLFQGNFKAALINKEEKLAYIPHYIHLNPLDLIFPKFKENGISDKKTANDFLESYRWSSYLDYCDTHNYPSVISKTLRDNIWQNSINYKNEIKDWIAENNFSKIVKYC